MAGPFIFGCIAVLALLPGVAVADSGQTAYGRPGDVKKIVRTVAVEMSDAMRFSPAEIAVKRGETIRFAVTNSGKQKHEMVLGTLSSLKAHAKLMQKYPGMEHDEPHMVDVEPGKTADLVWRFNRAGEFRYGCLVPGHFEAGMVGKVIVRP